MKIKSAEFVKSSKDVNLCPQRDIPEYAFIGRSNVGKSSLINKLTNKKKLAKTSGTPGKTQLINHFVINETDNPWFLVDLPGYGYAKVPKKEKSKWMGFIKRYLTSRENLVCVFVLVDCRHTPQRVDIEFMEWLAVKGVPFAMCFTKTDKLNADKAQKSIKKYQDKMLEDWEFLPDMFHSSAESGKGIDELLDYIQKINEDMKEN